MNMLISAHNALFGFLDRHSGAILGTLGRFVFAAVLLVYFWKSALTKFGDGLLGLVRPSDGAYYQIFPKFIESVSFDYGQLTFFHWLVAVLGMWAELILPALIVLGLLTRLASLGMIGFVAVQTYTDIYVAAHSKWGAWFDNIAEFDPSIKSIGLADSRVWWVFLLVVLVVKGAGPLSLDRLFKRLT